MFLMAPWLRELTPIFVTSSLLDGLETQILCLVLHFSGQGIRF